MHDVASTDPTAPDPDTLIALGLDPPRVTWTLLGGTHGHRLYRVREGRRSFVLKQVGTQSIEPRAYALLESLAVPTLQVHGRTDHALLLEDLETSSDWQAASEADASRAETGIAVAGWYRALHATGAGLLAGDSPAPAYLHRESDTLDGPAILQIGTRLGLEGMPVWSRAAEAIESLREALRRLPETLTYNDFHWTNLALSRAGEPPRALVYDYHLLGIGPPAADYRNVRSSLQGPARDAFAEAYGPVDARAAALDTPVATLHALQQAVQRPRLPSWAAPLIGQVTRGELARQLEEALALT